MRKISLIVAALLSLALPALGQTLGIVAGATPTDGFSNNQCVGSDGSTVKVIDCLTPSSGVATISFGTTGLTPSTPTSGTVAVAGTLGQTNGGTGSNLSATGGVSQVLKQASAGAAITVGQLAASDLSNGVIGSGAVVLANAPTLAGVMTVTTGGTHSFKVGNLTGATTYSAISLNDSLSNTNYIGIGGGGGVDGTLYLSAQSGSSTVFLAGGTPVATMGPGTGITTAQNVAIPAGGTTGTGNKFTSTSNFGTFPGSGAPTLSAARGSLYLRSDGLPYYNTNGTTGWDQLAGLGSNNTFSGTASFTNVSVSMTNLGSDAATTNNTACVTTTTGVLTKGSGTAGVCLGTSSARYKHAIEPQVEGLGVLGALSPVTYLYNEGYGDGGATRKYGFTAEQVYEIIPGIVGLDEGGKPNTVDWAALVPILVKGIQELKAEVDNLKSGVSK